MIETLFANLEYTPEGATTHWPDGTSWPAYPHPEMGHYHVVAARCGYGDDLLAYCREHELAHHVVAEYFHSHSLVLFALAHGEKAPPPIAAAEEALAMALQRFVRAAEVPFVDCVDWPGLKARFLELLGE